MTNVININAVFELMKITYEYWLHGLTDEQVRATKRLWAKNLRKFDEDTISQAMERCPRVFKDKAPTVGRFYDLCNSLVPVGSQPRISYQPDGERAAAKRATCIAFRRRICELPVEIDYLYTGSFPFNQVAEAVNLPEPGRFSDHQRAWDKLYRSFDAVWDEHVRIAKNSQRERDRSAG